MVIDAHQGDAVERQRFLVTAKLAARDYSPFDSRLDMKNAIDICLLDLNMRCE
jgi:hypothetical protein